MISLRITVVRAERATAQVSELRLPMGATVAQALKASGMLGEAERDGQERAADVGIFGKRVNLDHLLSDGDQIELYRPLIIDPKARRIQREKA